MAKSKLTYWLTEAQDKLIDIITNANTDREVYEAMGVGKDTFYKYMKNTDFSDLVKNTREKIIDDNAERLKQLREDMWKNAHEQVIEETIQEIETRDGKEYKYMKKTTKKMGGDTTLQIYLDKTYGKNINHDEIQSRVDYNKVRAEVQRLVLNPELDETTKAKLEAVKKILGGVESVIGKAE